MAKKTRGVWGIDIGQTALKAMRCQVNENGDVVADAYDYIEYPKILSMPDADEEALVDEAMQTFLARNDVAGDTVAMTVAGSAGLSRFFKPPPVDARTLPDIVKYEVRQQIPFPIEDVIWDWQSLGGSEIDGVMVDAEVGLFAIKRDTVYSALQPFLRKDIEVDIVQLSPLATQNVVLKEVFGDIPEDVDPETLTESVVIISMGTDSTDLIVSNGIRLWLRNIPIGGNHFTKELSRELKLTHAKAEQLKRNARQAEDPKTVFQAMRRVFNDLKKEIDRSLSFYAGIDKNARLERIVLLGNAAQLPGLRQFLTKQLEMEIVKLSGFDSLKGPVTEERSFRENILSFAPAYGLCLQGLNEAKLKTNLLPIEFINERIIRAKKPWALASVSLLMLGMLFGYFWVNQRWWQVQEEYSENGTSWKTAMADASAKSSRSATLKEEDDAQFTKLRFINRISDELAEASETRSSWAEVLSALDQALPRDPRLVDENGDLIMVADPNEVPWQDREEVYIDHIETQHFDELATWSEDVLPAFLDQRGEVEELEKFAGELEKKKAAARRGRKTAASSTAAQYDISGPGWVIELQGHHFFNSEDKRKLSQHGMAFVRDYVLNRMILETVRLPNAEGEMEEYKFEDIGLYFPTLVSKIGDDALQRNYRIPNPNFGLAGLDDDEDASEPGGDDRDQTDGSETPPADSGDGDAGDEEDEKEAMPEFFEVDRFDFVIQMACIPASAEERDRNKAARLKAESEKTEQLENAESTENAAEANGG